MGLPTGALFHTLNLHRDAGQRSRSFTDFLEDLRAFAISLTLIVQFEHDTADPIEAGSREDPPVRLVKVLMPWMPATWSISSSTSFTSSVDFISGQISSPANDDLSKLRI